MLSRIARCLAVLSGMLLAFTFALSATAKFDDPTDAIVFGVRGVGLSSHAAHHLALSIAMAEAVLAAWLAFDFGRTLKPGVASVVLMGFVSGLLLAAARGNPRSIWGCACFGALQSPWSGMSLQSHFRFDLFLLIGGFVHAASVFMWQRLPTVGAGRVASGSAESLLPAKDGECTGAS